MGILNHGIGQQIGNDRIKLFIVQCRLDQVHLTRMRSINCFVDPGGSFDKRMASGIASVGGRMHLNAMHAEAVDR